MGTIFAPTHEILTMGLFELTSYDLCRNKFGKDLGNFIFENWSRFFHDCDTLLEENKIKPNDLLSILNSINRLIHFIIEYSKDPISFPEILIKRATMMNFRWIFIIIQLILIGAFFFPLIALNIGTSFLQHF